MTDLIHRLRDWDLGDDHTGQRLLMEAADALEHISSVLVDKDREIERLSEIPCIMESPDGNPGWGTIGDAVKLLAAARRERDKAQLRADANLCPSDALRLVAERDRLQRERDELQRLRIVDVYPFKVERDRLRAALERIAAVLPRAEGAGHAEYAAVEMDRIAREALKGEKHD